MNNTHGGRGEHLQFPNHLYARHARHFEVREHHVKRLLSEQSQGFLAISSNGHLIPFATQNLLEQITVQFFVIDDQNAFRSHSVFPLSADDSAHLPSVRGAKILTLFWLCKVMEIHWRTRVATHFRGKPVCTKRCSTVFNCSTVLCNACMRLTISSAPDSGVGGTVERGSVGIRVWSYEQTTPC